MNTLNFIAELWGFGLVAFGFSLLINPKTANELFKSIENDLTLFYMGIITLILGVATLLNYDVWSNGWGSIITIIGWLAVIKGIFLSFFPSAAKKLYGKMGKKSFMPYMYCFVVILGLFLVCMGFIA
jgi:uncharacterized protein YjeT (DUF2065 family)